METWKCGIWLSSYGPSNNSNAMEKWKEDFGGFPAASTKIAIFLIKNYFLICNFKLKFPVFLGFYKFSKKIPTYVY